MPPSNLYTICVKKTCDFLMSGVWEKCEDNPFSSVPSTIVQDLLSVNLSDRFVTRGRITQSRLLLSSNMLENVDLLHAIGIEDFTLLFRMLFLGCRNLRRLLLPDYKYIKFTRRVGNEERALQDLLQNCSKLEELNVNIPFDPNYLRNCKNLRSLKLYLHGEGAIHFFCRVTSDILQCLPSLEVFGLSFPFQEAQLENKSIISASATILNSCPKLTSLGYLDSSMAVKEFYERQGMVNLLNPRCFQLRSCYWVAGEFSEQSVYSDMIRLAALSCLLLKVLVIEVHDTDSIQHLKTLKYITFLSITFRKIEQKHEFYSLLNEIGPQLQYLSVVAASPEDEFNVNMIVANCPNLRTLRLWCSITTDETVRPYVNLRQLKNLRVFNCDKKSLLFLLSKCHHLKVLCLMLCKSLNDELLRVIFQENCFMELEEALFTDAPISKSGMTKFFKTARMLKKFSSTFLHDDILVQYLQDLNPSVTLYLPRDYIETENYITTDDRYCFL